MLNITSWNILHDFVKGFGSFYSRLSNGLLTGCRIFLELKLGKMSSHFVILILRPTLEWVIVAFIAIEPSGEKQMGGVFHCILRSPQNFII